MKPHVICHMIMSLDGRIVSSRWNLSPEGRAEYEATAAIYQSNAWMCGRVTMAGFANGTPPAPGAAAPAIAKTDYIAPHPQTSFAIALDPAGKLYWARNEIGGDHLITVLTEKVSNDYLAHLRTAGVSYLFAGADRIDLPMVLDKLAAAFLIKTLLLEGGGKINGAMLQAGLIDELSLLVAPFPDGSTGTPTLFDLPPPFDTAGHAALAPPGAAALNTSAGRWKLRSIERRADDILWLRYTSS
jgi:2,5-diamino-6-(ribosylamino)-4(3H)-pyrimidinone 5'-phosphate reductase